MIIALNKEDKRDETAIVFRDEAKDVYESGLDGEKMRNSGFSLSSLTEDNADVAFNVLPWYTCMNEITLNMFNVADGTYTLDFKKLDSFEREISFSLVDQFTGSRFEISNEAEYTFMVNSDAASKAADRFKIEVSFSTLGASLLVEGNSVCTGEEAMVSVFNTENDVNYELQQNGIAVSETISGNGSTVDLVLDAKNLVEGENNFNIVGKRGCEEVVLENIATVYVNTRPEVSSVENGISCGAGPVVLKAFGAPEGAAYRWYETAESDSPIAEESQSSFITPYLKLTKKYYVSIINQDGCESAERKEVTAEIYHPENPTISETDKILYSSSQTGNQWYYNNKALEGETSPSLKPKKNGVYSVEVNINGCITLSDKYVFTLKKGIVTKNSKLELKIMPNPASKFLDVNYQGENVEFITIQVYELNGIKILEQKLLDNKNNGTLGGRIEVQNLKTGLYIIKAEDNNGDISYQRFIKE